jgi:hypothetical protein
MRDEETVRNMAETARASGELNEISQPLGYAVTFTAGGSLGRDSSPDHRRFTVHRIDQPVVNGPSGKAK